MLNADGELNARDDRSSLYSQCSEVPIELIKKTQQPNKHENEK